MNFIFRKVAGIFIFFLSLFRRAICRVKRFRKPSGNILPMTTAHIHVPDVQHSVPVNSEPEVELTGWDNWDGNEQPGDSNSIGFYGNTPLNNHYDNPSAGINHQDQQYSNASGYHQQTKFGKKPEPEPEPEPDYFSDMQPEFRKAQKILLRKKELENQQNGLLSSRLGVNVVPTPLDGEELSTCWDDGENAWGEEVEEDLTFEAEVAIKERKQAERERRQMEQMKRKQEREAARHARNSLSH